MPDAVAGILNAAGGLSVVTGPAWRMKYHVERGGRLFIVPGLTVEDDAEANARKVDVIDAVRRHVLAQLAPVNHCGECRACCKIPYLKTATFTKPSHQWCRFASAELGCKAYWQRPKECQAFQCKWLVSQKTTDPMAAELRPDKCGVMLTDDTSTGTDLLEVHVDRDTPDAAEQEPLASFLAGKQTKRITFYYGEAT